MYEYQIVIATLMMKKLASRAINADEVARANRFQLMTRACPIGGTSAIGRNRTKRTVIYTRSISAIAPCGALIFAPLMKKTNVSRGVRSGTSPVT